MHGIVHDFIVSQTVENWRELPTGQGNGVLIPAIIPLKQKAFKQKKYASVLEIGSLDINGSQRTYDFIGSNKPWVEMIGCEEYIGIDLVEGRGVDHVMDAHDLVFPDNEFDLVLCVDMIEHDSNIKETLKEAYRVLNKGGLLLVTTVDETHEEHMLVHPVELPYNHITEKELDNLVKSINPKSYKLWHIGDDLLVRIEK